MKGNLESAGMTVVILSRKDHVNVTTIGDLAVVDIMVPAEQADEARQYIADQDLDRDESTSLPVSDAELEAAALAADMPTAEAELTARLAREETDRTEMADEADNYFPSEHEAETDDEADADAEAPEPDRV